MLPPVQHPIWTRPKGALRHTTPTVSSSAIHLFIMRRSKSSVVDVVITVQNPTDGARNKTRKAERRERENGRAPPAYVFTGQRKNLSKALQCAWWCLLTPAAGHG